MKDIEGTLSTLNDAEASKVLGELIDQLENYKLFSYKPYPWQKKVHNLLRDNQEVMASAANRVGKTFCGAAETAMHLTGLYPDWWQGYRVNGPCLVWVGSQSTEQLRDVTQKELIGDLGAGYGTGAIPKMCLGKPQKRASSVTDVIDKIEITSFIDGDMTRPHKQKSVVQFKSYEQGWQKFQGTAPHFIWLDEEPDYKIFTECQTRLGTTQGRMLITFTPLSGHTDMVQHFTEEKPGTAMVMAGWDDAPHLDKKWCEEQLQRYPAHERDARTKGIPQLGTGRVFPFSDDDVVCDPFKIPRHYAQIIGIDFGSGTDGGHPSATVKLAFDRDNDIVYVVAAHKKKGMDALQHSENIIRMGGGVYTEQIPVAWPHDGVNTIKGGTTKLHRLYRQHNVYLLGRTARYDEKIGGGQPVEPIVMEVIERIQTGRFKVFSNLGDWLAEFRNYHRNDKGRLVDRMDDILKATFYALMDIRKARSLTKTGGTTAPPRPTVSMRR